MAEYSSPPPRYQRFDRLTRNSRQAWESISSDPSTETIPSSLQQVPQASNRSPGMKPSELAAMLWLCPHHGINFAEAKTRLAVSAFQTSTVDTTSLGDCVKDSCTKNVKSQMYWSFDMDGTKRYSVLTTIKLLCAPLEPDIKTASALYFTEDRISAALQGLDMPICAHLRLNHSFVQRRNDPNFMLAKTNDRPPRLYTCDPQETPPPTFRRKRVAASCCPICAEEQVNTTFAMGVQESRLTHLPNPLHFNIVMVRSLGLLHAPSSPEWLNYAILPTDRRCMEKVWHHWLDEISILRQQWNLDSSMRLAVANKRSKPLSPQVTPGNGHNVSP